MRELTLTDSLLAPALASGRGRPLLTHYDEVAGTRVELSAATAANWAAKTANLLVDEFGVGEGDAVFVDVPRAWPLVGILLGAWWTGCEVVCGGDGDGTGADCTVAFVEPAGVADCAADEVVAVGSDPLGRGLTEGPAGIALPPGVADYAPAVRIHGDDFRAFAAPDGAVLAGMTTAEVLTRGRDAATAAGLADGVRILETGPLGDSAAVLRALVAPLLRGGSLVRVLGAPATALVERRAAAENAILPTCTRDRAALAPPEPSTPHR